MSKSALFVYGSMMKGMVHHNKLAAMVKEIKPATCEGTLYRLPVGYPAMVEGPGIVRGELLALDKFKDIIKIIDEFEGFSMTTPEKSLYIRMEKPILVEGAKKPVTSCT